MYVIQYTANEHHYRSKTGILKYVAEHKVSYYPNTKKDTELQTTAPFKWM